MEFFCLSLYIFSTPFFFANIAIRTLFFFFFFSCRTGKNRSVTLGLTGLSFLVGPRARQPAFQLHSAHTQIVVPDFIATSESGAVLHCKQRAARGGREGGAADAVCEKKKKMSSSSRRRKRRRR